MLKSKLLSKPASSKPTYPSKCGVKEYITLQDLGLYLTAKPGPNGYGSSTTAADVVKNWDGHGKVAFVTGGSGGMGLETSKRLADRGAHVFIGCRSVDGARETFDKYARESGTPASRFTVLPLDLSSQSSVRQCAAMFLDTGKQLNILVNNGGLIGPPPELSVDGIEMQFATNQLGHFLLTRLLIDNIIETAEKQKVEGRVVNVSSLGHRAPYPEGIKFHNINDMRGYNRILSYGQVKLAQLLFARELQQRLGDLPVASVALHPGLILSGLGRHVDAKIPLPIYDGVRLLTKPIIKSVQQGAANHVYLATADSVERGDYYVDLNPAPCSEYGINAVMGRKLWDFSEQLVGL